MPSRTTQVSPASLDGLPVVPYLPMGERRYGALIRLAALILLLSATAVSAQPAANRVVRIGFVMDGPWARNDEVLSMVHAEILELLSGEYDVRFPAEKRIVADWTPEGVAAALDNLLADSEVDIVMAMGVLASDRAARLTAPRKPVLAPVVIDADIQGLPSREGTSGVHNLAYLTVPAAVERDIRSFHSLVPFERLTILGNRYIATSIPDLGERVRKLATREGIEPTLVQVGDSAAQALAALPPDAQAVYLLPLLQMSSSSFDSLVAGLIARRLPSFSAMGEKEVERGVLAGASLDLFPRLARRLAVTLQRILAGEDAGTLPTSFPIDDRLTINMATARAIGFHPSWAGLNDAQVVGDARGTQAERSLTLVSAMQEAVQFNLDLAAVESSVAAGEQEVKEARSALLPQAEISAQGNTIDRDRAEASFGAQAERIFSVTARASQIVFSEPALAQLSIERHLQRARLRERDQDRLEIVRAAGGAYLNLLRAKTLERIRQETLRLSRDHLDLARQRERVGSAGLSDVYRWESEIATNRRSAIDANASRNQAEIQLNRILNRPGEEPFLASDISLEDPEAASVLPAPLDYFDSKISFAVLRDFMVEEGLSLSPQLKALDEAIAAGRRGHDSATRAFYLPSLALEGSVSNLLDRSGAGSSPPSFPGLPAPEFDDTEWNIGLRASYPLFEGGSRLAAHRRTRWELAQLEFQRRAAAERVEQQIRDALHRAGASYAGIREARQASEWARKNLGLVTDSYSRGAVSLINLLDAQNSHVVAEQDAADAVYDFLDDGLEVQQAVGRFNFTLTEAERADLVERLRAFAASQGATPGAPARKE